MKLIVDLFAAAAWLGGVILFVIAVTRPNQYGSLGGASAVQVTQVYTEAIFFALLSVAAFACGVFLLLASRAPAETP